MAFAQSEEILSYHSQIKIEPNSTLVVKETIVVRANNNQIKHGIYRDFPTVYYDDKGRKVKTGFDVISVRRDGQLEPSKKKGQSNGERLYIGSPQSYVSPGVHRYEIEFRTSNQLGYFADHDELYFNAIGTGWVFPIRKASAEVELPEGLSQSQISTYGYTGVQGSKEGAYRASVLDGKRVYFEITRELLANEGFTIVVAWPKGFVKKPIDMELVGYAVGALIGLIIFIYYFVSWWFVGQDPQKGTIIPLYNAPQGLSPADVRYIYKMEYDNKCLFSMLISLATKGYLQVREDASGLFGTKKYTIAKDLNRSGGQSAVEQDMMNVLFADRNNIELDNKNYKLFQRLNKKLLSSLKDAFQDELFHLNRKYLLLPFAIFLITIVFCFAAKTSFSMAIVLVIGPVFLVLTALFYSLLKAPTQKGREILDHIEGYKMYLATAEAQDIAAANAQNITAELYEEHLPYAIALGVDSEWTEKFEASLSRLGNDISSYHPTWYAGNRSWHDSKGFMSVVGSGLSSAIAAASTPPGSSSGGGGSGSSGGGGGGGGGGGW